MPHKMKQIFFVGLLNVLLISIILMAIAVMSSAIYSNRLPEVSIRIPSSFVIDMELGGTYASKKGGKMSKSPSHYRRMGREAFEPNVDPMDVDPFDPSSWWYDSRLKNWLEGWEEARQNWEVSQVSEECCPHCKRPY